MGALSELEVGGPRVASRSLQLRAFAGNAARASASGVAFGVAYCLVNRKETDEDRSAREAAARQPVAATGVAPGGRPPRAGGMDTCSGPR